MLQGWGGSVEMHESLSTLGLKFLPAKFQVETIDFLGKFAEKIANGDHMIVGHLTIGYKYKWVAK